MVPALTCWPRKSCNFAVGVVLTCTTKVSLGAAPSGGPAEDPADGGASNSCFTAAAKSAFAVTMTMCRAVPDLISASFAGTRLPPAIKAGISSVKRRNVLERMRSRYSRWTMSQTLCIFPDHVDKNLFQRRFEQLKTGDARAVGGPVQQLLGVRSGFQADFYIVPVIVERLHQIVTFQLGIPLILHLHVVLTIARLDFFQIAFQDGPAMVNQADGISYSLDLFHTMGGEQYGFSILLQLQ